MSSRHQRRRPGAYNDYATIPAISRELAIRLGNYEFKLGHALRDLPVETRYEILDEVRNGILDAIEHLVKRGVTPSKALAQVLAEYRAPKDLAREYRQANRGPALDVALLLDFATIGACIFGAVHATSNSPGQNDGIAGVAIWIFLIGAALSIFVTRLPLRWVSRTLVSSAERCMVGFQFFAMGAIGQAIPAALSYNLASHDLKLTLQHVSIRTVVVLCGIGAAEHHRRRVGRVRIARRLAGEPRAYFEEFFSDETGEVAKRRRRALEYFTQEEL